MQVNVSKTNGQHDCQIQCFTHRNVTSYWSAWWSRKMHSIPVALIFIMDMYDFVVEYVYYAFAEHMHICLCQMITKDMVSVKPNDFLELASTYFVHHNCWTFNTIVFNDYTIRSQILSQENNCLVVVQWWLGHIHV